MYVSKIIHHSLNVVNLLGVHNLGKRCEFKTLPPELKNAPRIYKQITELSRRQDGGHW